MLHSGKCSYTVFFHSVLIDDGPHLTGSEYLSRGFISTGNMSPDGIARTGSGQINPYPNSLRPVLPPSTTRRRITSNEAGGIHWLVPFVSSHDQSNKKA